jgi:competence protein ComEC
VRKRVDGVRRHFVPTWASLPLVPLAVALGAGIAVTPWVSSRFAWAVWLAGVTVGLAALLARRPVLGAAAMLAAVAALGILRATPAPLPGDHIARLPLPTRADVEGRLVASPVPATGRVRLLIDVERVDDERRSGRLQLTAYGDGLELVTGQRIRTDARLATPVGFRNPGGFDYVARLARDGIHVTGSTRTDHVIALDAPAAPWHERVRRRAVTAIEDTLPQASAALLAGLLLGERRSLPFEIDDGFRRAGVYHVLAVSGFNVALVASAVFLLVRLIGLGRRSAAGSAGVVVLAFGAVVGPQPSVLRAVVMAVLVLTAVLLDRDTEVLNSLAAAALLILAFRPWDLLDPGFQLSFAATAAIVLAPRPRHPILGALAVSAAAQVSVLPVTLWHFHQVSVVGLVANLAVVPLAAVATVVGLAGAALAFVWDAAARVAFDAVWPVLLALRAAVACAAAVPHALIYLPAPPAAAIVAYSAALVLTAAAWRLRRARPRAMRYMAGVAVGALAVAIVFAAWPLARPRDGRLHVAVLDVGQGDALVIEGTDGRAVVVDAGPGGRQRLDAGERVVAPYLWWRGLLRVRATIVTHDHADHGGGMAAVRTRFPGAEVWTADALAATPRALGGAVLSALPVALGPRPNDHALVLRVDYGAASFLLTSDIPGAAEGALIARGAPVDATVLKVAHHGARDSSTAAFLAAVRPTLAAVSVGARNPYRHPDAGVLARLEATGARVLRTDRDGALLFETDGRTLEVTTWASGRRERWCLDPEVMC